jgi:putative FmdB family regulatory protein
MPIYDYLCADCGTTYDVFHKVREIEEDILCPSCGSANHHRLIGKPNVAVSARSFSSPMPSDCSSSGGCCGGSCGLD